MRFGAALKLLTAGAALWTAVVPALANAPEFSLRPEIRPSAEASVSEGVMILSPDAASLRPRLRPGDGDIDAAVPVMAFAAVAPAPGLAVSLRPLQRPKAVEQDAIEYVAARRRGQICGDPALQGDKIAPVPGRIAGCGVAEPILLKSVAGVALSTPAIMDCRTAEALKTWVNRGVKPAIGTRGGGVSSLRVAAHYSCRTRNNRPGAKISEHGKGRAIDISGIRLKDGHEMTLIEDWGRGEDGRALRKMWRAACGPFGTVLGPEADVYHKDHFHFDTARYRSGSYCR
ncbi:MAG: extensin family protein [Pseudomonadota bacterium]